MRLGGAALMSGSGPAVFAIFPGETAAREAAREIKKEALFSGRAKKPNSKREEVYVAKTCSYGVNVVYEKPKA